VFLQRPPLGSFTRRQHGDFTFLWTSQHHRCAAYRMPLTVLECDELVSMVQLRWCFIHSCLDHNLM
jgi:hypothetical protein